MNHPLTLERLFDEARTQRRYFDRPLPEGTLEALYEHLKWGPTSGNYCPARFTFVQSKQAREQLADCASEGNRERIRTAPATVIIATDEKFYEHLGLLVPHRPNAADDFRNKPELAATTALRNGTLQGAYLMLAARGLGLDCTPMSGFKAEEVNARFFADSSWRVNFICCLGYGDPQALHPRAPRLSFNQACQVL